MKNTMNTSIFKAININCLRHCLLKSLSHRVIAKLEMSLENHRLHEKTKQASSRDNYIIMSLRRFYRV